MSIRVVDCILTIVLIYLLVNTVELKIQINDEDND
jgi:hypothetical protein